LKALLRAVRSGLIAVLLAAIPIGLRAQDNPSTEAHAALAAYVAKPDASYAWRIHARYEHRGAEIIELRLNSQTWQDVPWKHQLLLVKPDRVVGENQGLLIIGGGRWRDEYDRVPTSSLLPEGAEIFVAIARRLRTVVAVVGQVPFQPLFDRREDELIAYTFDRYLDTGDEEWPLLLPMVKSAVRAMDASSGLAGREWGMPLRTFTVLGGSKRGWTAWLTAAVDSRVTALVPVVIDALNMARHFPYQSEVWGEPSEEIRPYTELNLHNVLASDEGRALREIVDPFSYRAAITQPKLIVLATNDGYFPVDSANLYWDELDGPKYLLYLPNDRHSVRDYARLVGTLRALHESGSSAAPLPTLEWEYRWADDALALCVRSDPAPRAVRVWTAASEDRDFRNAVWAAGPERRRDDRYVLSVSRPSAGYIAVFAEATYGRGRSAYSLSTNLAVLAAPSARDVGPHPVGSEGVCGSPGPL
jgi:PhoPQ-activated pathogenicity-related protein